MMYGYNPPRQNPEYCQGFRIDHPSTPGLVFAAGSHQYAQWSIDDKGLANAPEVVFRIRILNATQHNNLNIGENIPMYNKGKTGSLFYPLKVTGVDGLYHLRFMVKYAGEELNCVYESVPFTVVHDPAQKCAIGEAPYFDTNPSYTYMTKSMEDLYENINTTAVFV
ncbi:hypothetical protein BD408DRAFT_408333 [Parasitella parasitica]|nr:hypothetical protein BD408DRAFT_408333 [Parasitella parasitica]